jgi:hypothetical protein
VRIQPAGAEMKEISEKAERCTNIELGRAISGNRRLTRGFEGQRI